MQFHNIFLTVTVSFECNNCHHTVKLSDSTLSDKTLLNCLSCDNKTQRLPDVSERDLQALQNAFNELVLKLTEKIHE